MGKAAADQSPDGQVIVQLVKSGSDLTKLHPIEFYFYFPTKEAAHRVVAKLMAEEGFVTQVNYSAYGNDWLILATKAMLPDEAQLLALRKKFEAMATEENGEFDGWGTPVVE